MNITSIQCVHRVHCMIVDDGQCTCQNRKTQLGSVGAWGCVTSCHTCYSNLDQHCPESDSVIARRRESLGSLEFPSSTVSERREAAEITLPISLLTFCAENPHHYKAIPPTVGLPDNIARKIIR